MQLRGVMKWIYKPFGQCPVQAEGWFFGYYFYFRSRWSASTIEFSKSEQDWKDDKIIKDYILYQTSDPYSAGWITNKKALQLIYKGFLFFSMYLLKIKLKKLCK